MENIFLESNCFYGILYIGVECTAALLRSTGSFDAETHLDHTVQGKLLLTASVGLIFIMW